MNARPDLTLPSAQSSPPGTSIQHGADQILAVIDSERQHVARIFHLRYNELEDHFARYRENAKAAIGAEVQRVRDLEQNLAATRRLLAQYTSATHPSSAISFPRQMLVAARDFHHHQLGMEKASQTEGASAEQRLGYLQNLLKDVGITFCTEDNSLTFGACWAAVLGQLDVREFGVLDGGRLQEILQQLAYKLHSDKETVERLERRISILDAEKAELISYQLEVSKSASYSLPIPSAVTENVANPCYPPSMLIVETR
ncbi:hypothetical protein H0H92_000071 [Tricholoma furcatifolium]|nr:hypothetical protein H0H92_000071 [Tricholoma furcatifolium]